MGGGGVNAQPAADDVRVITIDFAGTQPSISANHSLHNQIYLNLTNFSPAGLEWWYIPEDPSYGPELQVFPGINGPINFPASSANIERTIVIVAKDANGNLINGIGVSASVVFKATYTVNSTGFTPPDETWSVNTSATFTPPVPNAFPAGSPYLGNAVSGGHAYIKFAPGHDGKLKKPLIFVEGIDFGTETRTYNGTVIRHGGTGWDAIMMGNDAGGISDLNEEISYFNYYPAGINTLLSNGYDIVFLDFASGADYIQKNGLVLVKLIEMVNARRAVDDRENASSCENVLVGASMGGQVTKWALGYMETNNIPHQSHTYISFDSPQKGANIPIGIQALAFMNTMIPGGETGQWDNLNTPAARQMLLETLESGVSSGRLSIDAFKTRYDAFTGFLFNLPVITTLGYSGTEAIRESFLSEVGGLGYPQRTRNVAISCGSSVGTQLDFANNDTYFKANLHIDLNGFENIACANTGEALYVECVGLNGNDNTNFKQLIFDSAPGIGGCTYQYINGPANTLFLASLPTDLDDWVGNAKPPVEALVMTVKSNTNYPSFDNAPGCKRGDLDDIEDKLSMASDEITFFNKTYTTFMPTLSLLDIQWPMDDEHLVMHIPSNAIESNLTPFEAFYAPIENLRHVELTAAMVQFVVEQSAIGRAQVNVQPLNLVNGQHYNYGKGKNIVPDVTINSGSRLSVNVAGTINYMTAGDPVADKPHFEVFTGRGCDPGRIITVKSGGTLQIGDPDDATKTGIFHAMKDAIIHIESGGTLRISNSSSLIIYPGAQLIMDDDAQIVLDDPESVVDIQGTWTVNGDFSFFGLGYVNYNGDLELGPNTSRFRFLGYIPYHRCLKLLKPLAIPVGKNLLLGRGGVECAGYGLGVKSSSEVHCYSFLFTGTGTGITAQGSGEVHLENCLFDDMERPFWIRGPLNSASTGGGTNNVIVNGSTFNNPLSGALIELRNDIRFTNCTFNQLNSGPMNDGYALYSNRNYKFLFRNSTIQGFRSPTPANHYFTAGDVLSDNELYEGLRVQGGFQAWIDGSTISNCDIGIGSRSSTLPDTESHFPSNILLTNLTTLRDCISGVAAEGDIVSGVVFASCAKFIDNQFSIGGTDMTLMIDPSQNNPFPQHAPYPNHFIRPGSFVSNGNDNKYISMCYAAKNPGGSIMATHNYFGVHNPNNYTMIDTATQSQLNLSFDVRRVNTGGDCNTGYSAIVVHTAPSSNLPRLCSDGIEMCEGDNCIRDCNLTVSNDAYTGTVRSRFLDGMGEIWADDNAMAATNFESVSNLWQSDLPSSYSDECRTFIQSARSFTIGAGDRYSNFSQKAAMDILRIIPNPACAGTRVMLYGHTTFTGDIWLLDITGKQIAGLRAESGVLDLPETLTPGYYIIKTENGKVFQLCVSH